MNQDAFKEIWEARIKTQAEELSKASGAGAILVAIFDGPWMTGKDPAILGMAGKPDVDLFRIARDLRVMADQVEKSVARFGEDQPRQQSWEEKRPGPVRQ